MSEQKKDFLTQTAQDTQKALIKAGKAYHISKSNQMLVALCGLFSILGVVNFFIHNVIYDLLQFFMGAVFLVLLYADWSSTRAEQKQKQKQESETHVSQTTTSTTYS